MDFRLQIIDVLFGRIDFKLNPVEVIGHAP
jgi:hypothetical protein